MKLLKQGLYEQVINQEILEQLNSLDQDKFIINRSGLDKEEAKAILSQYIAQVSFKL